MRINLETIADEVDFDFDIQGYLTGMCTSHLDSEAGLFESFMYSLSLFFC